MATYKAWEARLDAAIWRKCGMGLLDLPDADTWAMWDEGLTPRRAADLVIAQAQDW